ncbi:DUF2238 domain-containing protein [uncultured Methylophaga sp.]|uniref:DUF2238 domain-containing protein n=1 Tax=uncultured Methylophaga sp. TaxID=285271 RepID=UPI0026068B31|nr:DUF2238 domain-containing protein [uncultured Methylophaga sp.]
MDESTLHSRLTTLLQIILLAGAVGAVWEQQWFNAVIISGIILITLLPQLLARRFHVVIPAEFQLLTIGFVFASLFLGEVHGYYTRFWWWDIVLHTSSGFLLGIIGFLLVYVLNETEQIQLKMRPGFVAFFAFLFALGTGAVWEIFEFTVDSLFGTDMQKTMLGDSSGLTDTMWDLIVDTVGALIISVLGYGYLKAKRDESFLRRWIRKFIKSNPRLFRQS